MAFKKTYEELNMLLPFSLYVNIQQRQREQMAIMSFLVGLSFDFKTAKSHVLSDSEISFLHEVFSRVLRTESTPPVQFNDALAYFMKLLTLILYLKMKWQNVRINIFLKLHKPYYFK